MNDRRKNLVALAFKVLDVDKSGLVDMRDIEARYDAKHHPDVIAGRCTAQEVLQDFLLSFTRRPKKKNLAGTHTNNSNNNSNNNNRGDAAELSITLLEFEDYYANISASIDSDDYFELMIRNAWHLSGGVGQYANSSNRRVLVTHADGRQTVEELTDDIHINTKDTKAIIENLQRNNSTMKVATVNLSDLDDMKHQRENEEYYLKERAVDTNAYYQSDHSSKNHVYHNPNTKTSALAAYLTDPPPQKRSTRSSGSYSNHRYK